MIPTTYNMPKTLKGDTFKGILFTLQNGVDNVPIDLTGAAIKIQFRKGSKIGPVQKELSIGTGITVVTPALGKIQIDAFVADFPVSIYYYDVQISFSDVDIRTYIEGNLQVIQDVTQ